ncbi:hypothetical protein EG028_02590 [Chitinophaga barathri]|uniref:DUF5723 domain-containing protein n=2 Tax=Chitinophaga barathri TaxID=1647451 RepID=A0A3N4N6E0_9BACT|nr:hypothetical protein EG028_02590 [Chitinophaga barathri]
MLMLCAAVSTQAQVFPGYHTSQYAGIHAVPFNPALAAGTRYRWDVNIVGLDAKAGNTYIRANKSSLLSGDKLVRNVDYFPDSTATRKQYGWGSADLMLPSVLYSIDERQSVAFTWRVRGSSYGGGVETSTANFFTLNYPNPRFFDRTFADNYGSGMGHAWNEFGFSYARVIKDQGDHRWKAGITVKYLGGQAAAYGVGRDAAFVFEDRNRVDINSGKFFYGYNEGLDEWDKNNQLSNFSPFQNPGIGADIGVVYEWRPDNDGFNTMQEGGDWNPDADTWKARIAVSIVDIGGISYKKSATSADLDMRAQDFPASLLNKRKEESMRAWTSRLSSMFTPLETDEKFYMNLPTSLNLMGDYNIDGRFFVSASATIALNGGKKDDNKTTALTQFQITPRWESTHLGAYLPIQVNRFGQADAGVALRAGPLVLGSASLFTNLFRENINHADVFVALRIIPIRFNKWSWDKGNGGIFRKKRNQLGCPDI